MKRLLLILIPFVCFAQNYPFRANIVPTPGYPDSIGTPLLHWNYIFVDHYYGLYAGAFVDTSTDSQHLARQWRLAGLIPWTDTGGVKLVNFWQLANYYARGDTASVLASKSFVANQYAAVSSLSGYVPTSRTITINSISHDLSANSSYSVGTVSQLDTTQASFNISASTLGMPLADFPRKSCPNTFTQNIISQGWIESGVANSASGIFRLYDQSSSYFTNLAAKSILTSTNHTFYLPDRTTDTLVVGAQLGAYVPTASLAVDTTKPNFGS